MLENILFSISIYKLRNITDEFSIAEELKYVYIAWGLSGFCATLLLTFIPI